MIKKNNIKLVAIYIPRSYIKAEIIFLYRLLNIKILNLVTLQQIYIMFPYYNTYIYISPIIL